MGTQLPLPQRGTAPNVRCAQTAGWIKMPLSMEVNLGPGDVVLDGNPAPPAKRAQQPPPPLFGPCLLWPRSPISATAELLFSVAILLIVLH